MLETLLFREAQALEPGVNLDSITEPGIYDTTGTVGGPFSDPCYLLVIRPALDVRPQGTMQRAWPITGGAERTRLISATGVWGPWSPPSVVDEVLFRRATNANEMDETLLVTLPSGTGTFHNQGLAGGNLGNSSVFGTQVAGSLASSSRRNISTGVAASTNNIAGTRADGAPLWRGNASGRGGFTVSVRWNRETSSANTRGFFGLFASINNPVNNVVFPTIATWIDVFGVGFEADSGNYKLYHNDGTGAPTQVDLGASFPVAAAADDVYQLTLHCKPNDTVMYYMLENRSTGARTVGSVSSELPTNTVFLRLYATIGSTFDTAQSATAWHKFHALTPRQ